MKWTSVLTVSALAMTALTLTACDYPDLPAGTLSGAGTPPPTGTGSSPSTTLPTPAPSTSPSPNPTPNPTPSPSATPTSTSSYPSCVSSNSSATCIGLKIVSYQSSAGITDISESQAVSLVNSMNTIWSQCSIAFQLEVYQSIDPTSLGLPYSPNWESQTDAVRTAFADPTRFLVADVGPWTGSTVAVTTMPGSGVYGSIVDLAYADNYLTVAHEIAHYEGLYDESGDSNNLLSEVYSPDETQLTASQCATAQSINSQYWKAMERTP